MVEQNSLDGRALTKSVIADASEVWRNIWLEAIALREGNPAMQQFAESQPDDPEQAIRVLIPNLMALHPRIAQSVVVLLDLTIEDARREAVSPPRDDPFGTEHQFEGDGDRDVEQGVGGGQQQDRAADSERLDRLEQWHADLEDEVVRLRRLIAEFGAQAVRPTNTA